MAGEVFNRHEQKYMIHDELTYSRLMARLSDYAEWDIHNDTYRISNLYYDTDDSQLIRTSLEKPAYKEKLRIRAYGSPDEDSSVYIEIKKKVNGVVNKRRCAMSLSEAYRFLDIGCAPETCQNRQVISEIKTILERYPVKPALYLSYDRIALGETDRDDLRVTFDMNIVTRRTDLLLEAGSFGENLLPDGMRLMEIKVKNNMPLWLSRSLSELGIYPVSFSKYGTEYKKMLTVPNENKLYIMPASRFANTLLHGERRVSHA